MPVSLCLGGWVSQLHSFQYLQYQQIKLYFRDKSQVYVQIATLEMDSLVAKITSHFGFKKNNFSVSNLIDLFYA